MAIEKGYQNIDNVHRIDAKTSGILIFSKVKSDFQKNFRQGTTHKEYVAVVDGEFPVEETKVDFPLETNFMANTTLKEKPKMDSLTIFQRLHYDSETNTSLVKCFPKTGRTHQIRRHLQMINFPIVGDSKYNEKDIIDWDSDYRTVVEDCWKRINERIKNPHDLSNIVLNDKDWKDNLYEKIGKKASHCLDCEMNESDANRFTNLMAKPMCLHSHIYEVNGKKFEASLPKWATDSTALKNILIKRRK